MKIFYFIIIILSFNLISCFTKVDLDIPDEEPHIVVNSLITKDSLINLHISETVPMQSLDIKQTDNAVAVLYTEGVFTENLEHKEGGIYQSAVIAQTGVNYQIYIDVPNFEQIYSSANIPEAVNITEGYFKEDSYYDQQQMHYVSEAEISFYDPPGIKNYYQVTFYSYHYGEYTWDPITETMIVTDSTISFDHIIFYLNSKDPVILNEGDLQYYNDPISIKSLVFSDELLSEDSSVKFLVRLMGGYFSRHVAVLRSISYDYYKFKKSFIRQAFNQGIGNIEPTSMLLVSNPNDLYTNIENGLGIFAGYSEMHFELEEIE